MTKKDFESFLKSQAIPRYANSVFLHIVSKVVSKSKTYGNYPEFEDLTEVDVAFLSAKNGVDFFAYFLIE